MPIDYKKYPSNWKSEIRPSILERANNCCEFCQLENYSQGLREADGMFIHWAEIENALENRGYDYFEEELKHHVSKDGKVERLTKIVLTIAHLDHNINNNDYSNLKALCQRCHNRYDIGFRKSNRKINKGVLLLF